MERQRCRRQCCDNCRSTCFPDFRKITEFDARMEHKSVYVSIELRIWGFDFGIDFLAENSKILKRMENPPKSQSCLGFSWLFRSSNQILQTMCDIHPIHSVPVPDSHGSTGGRGHIGLTESESDFCAVIYRDYGGHSTRPPYASRRGGLPEIWVRNRSLNYCCHLSANSPP